MPGQNICPRPYSFSGGVFDLMLAIAVEAGICFDVKAIMRFESK